MPVRDHHPDQVHDHDGLAHDLHAIVAAMARRRVLRWLGAAGVLGVAGCGGGGGDADAATASASSASASGAGGTATGTTAAASGCSVIPEETAGPYPADGSNAAAGSIANALMLSGIVRSDIRASISGATGVATGVPLTVELRLVDAGAGCADLSGFAVYIWHCDRDGDYSLYSAGITHENYLRGVQETDGAGQVSFTTVFPGCYAGRVPHIHVEIYRTATTATSWTNKLRTSQLTFPLDACGTIYANASGYTASIANLARIGFASDNVFSDGVQTQLATLTGSVAAGYVATLVVGIAA